MNPNAEVASDCEECGQADGWNEVEISGLLARVMVERCDACERFTSDVEARTYLLRMLHAAPGLLKACIRTKEILDAWGPGRRGHTLELLHGQLSEAIAKAEPST